MLEKIKKIQMIVGVEADGMIGPKTLKAICEKLNITYVSIQKACVRNIQTNVDVVADGIISAKTLDAILSSISKPTIVESIKNLWGKLFNNKTTQEPKKFNPTQMEYKTKLVKQSTIRRGNSSFGPAGCEDRLVSVKIPEGYPMKYDGKPVKSIRIHELVADRLEAALNDILAYYGPDIEKIVPGACVYDGSYNFRKTRNSSSQSIHSWGLAIDFDAANNQLKTKSPYARFSREEYKPFIDILEHHGFASLGRRSDRRLDALSGNTLGLNIIKITGSERDPLLYGKILAESAVG